MGKELVAAYLEYTKNRDAVVFERMSTYWESDKSVKGRLREGIWTDFTQIHLPDEQGIDLARIGFEEVFPVEACIVSRDCGLVKFIVVVTGGIFFAIPGIVHAVIFVVKREIVDCRFFWLGSVLLVIGCAGLHLLQ